MTNEDLVRFWVMVTLLLALIASNVEWWHAYKHRTAELEQCRSVVAAMVVTAPVYALTVGQNTPTVEIYRCDGICSTDLWDKTPQLANLHAARVWK